MQQKKLIFSMNMNILSNAMNTIKIYKKFNNIFKLL